MTLPAIVMAGLMLAERGYVALALNMYGKVDLSLQEAHDQSGRLMSDAALMRRRARAALDVLASQPHCDATRLAAVGFCLGGIVALELARDRAPIRCAVGFHPGLLRPTGSTSGPIEAKVLMMIGSYTNRDIDAMRIPGFAYNERADRRPWKLMPSLLDEVFGRGRGI